MNRTFLFLSLFSFAFGKQPLRAQDTFSIIAVDPETGEVGSAGASCVDAAVYGGVILLNDLIPGRGGVNAQATVCLPVHINLVNGIARMQEGMSPQEIIAWLTANDACISGNATNRQYGIADFDPDGQPRSAAYTGANCIQYAGHRTGPTYAIQGNILMGAAIPDSMEARFLAEEGPLAKKLMAALQGANVPGADTRCLAAGTSSRSAFLRVAKPDDQPGDFWLELNVILTPQGVEPIDSLQVLFNEWYTSTGAALVLPTPPVVQVYPNPTNGPLTVYFLPSENAGALLRLYNPSGRRVLEQPLVSGRNQVDLPVLRPYSFLLLSVEDVRGMRLHTEKLLLLSHD